jgi:hypothetical protein
MRDFKAIKVPFLPRRTNRCHREKNWLVFVQIFALERGIPKINTSSISLKVNTYFENTLIHKHYFTLTFTHVLTFRYTYSPSNHFLSYLQYLLYRIGLQGEALCQVSWVKFILLLCGHIFCLNKPLGTNKVYYLCRLIFKKYIY